MANGRITKEVVYGMFSDIQKDIGDMKGQIGRVAGKVDAVCAEVLGMKGTVNDHTEKIGTLTGTEKAGSKWGTVVVSVLSTAFVALAIFLITRGGAP